MQNNDVDRLMRHAEANIDLAEAAKGPPSYWASLPLCIIDSVFSIRARYSGVVRVVKRWCESHQPPWEGETSRKPKGNAGPTLREFVDIVDLRLAHGCTYADLFSNRQRTSAKSGVLKAEAVHLFAKALLDSGVDTFLDVRHRSKLEAAEKRVKEIPGQGSGITFKYFLMLAGEDDYVKADVHLCRFVSDALCIDWKHLVSQERATELVMEAARRFTQKHPGLTPTGLDYAIWNYQHTRTRPSPICA
ncbi:MAG: hypothetical protein ACRD3A_10185 [Terriglobales bacterium]